MPQPQVFRSITDESEERFRASLLSYLVVAGLSEHDAAHAAELVAGVTWILIGGHKLRGEVQS